MAAGFGAGVLVAALPATVIARSASEPAAPIGAPELHASSSQEPTVADGDGAITAAPLAPTVAPSSGGVITVPRTDTLSEDAPSDLPSDLPDARVLEEVEDCPEASAEVSSAEELDDALDDAAAGAVIRLADGTYSGEFAITASGTADAPIWICGSSKAVLAGEGHDGGYGFHVDGAEHVRLHGFSVTDSQKGVMVDGGRWIVIESLVVRSIGDEAVHLRGHTTDSVVRGNTIHDTGNRREKFGEGVYVGSARSNWCSITDCEPDRSDRNVVEGNVIYDVTAEAVDIKEGSSSGILRGNAFDGSSLVEDGADSWVDVKGNDWMIVANSGVNTANDGFQVHEILDGWGRGNVFTDNVASVSGPGFGFSMTPEQDNVVACSNTVTGAKEGYSNVECQ